MQGRFLWVVLAFAIGSAGIVVWLGQGQEGVENQFGNGVDPVQVFLETHWVRPLEPVGALVGGSKTPSLDAQTCGACHQSQYGDWVGSRHRQAMAAGILWQFHVYNQAQSNDCMDCHAPLVEQKALVAIEHGWSIRPQGSPPPYMVPDLHLQGITCAACHVRSSAVFGPPSRVGLTGAEPGLPHAGFIAHNAFEDSRFCSGCHQFPDDGPRLNGKLRQDTYNEWLESEYPAQGMGCQQCHMPDRRHLWRGISDSDMVARALLVEFSEFNEQGQPMVRLDLANVGAGHRLPTYLVPQIEIKAVWVDDQGRELGLVIQHILQWRASLDLSTEYFDQRLGPGERRILTAPLVPPSEAEAIEIMIRVAPKEHYERVYRDMLRQSDRMSDSLLELLHQAILQASLSEYALAHVTIPLGAPLAWSFAP